VAIWRLGRNGRERGALFLDEVVNVEGIFKRSEPFGARRCPALPAASSGSRSASIKLITSARAVTWARLGRVPSVT
jgi:hypothetical protein